MCNGYCNLKDSVFKLLQIVTCQIFRTFYFRITSVCKYFWITLTCFYYGLLSICNKSFQRNIKGPFGDWRELYDDGLIYWLTAGLIHVLFQTIYPNTISERSKKFVDAFDVLARNGEEILNNHQYTIHIRNERKLVIESPKETCITRSRI